MLSINGLSIGIWRDYALERLTQTDKLDVSAFHGLDPVRAELYRLAPIIRNWNQ